MKVTAWERDDGYCGCKVARHNEIAVVICPPDYAGGDWGFQAFDESDEAAIESGEYAFARYGFRTEEDAISFVERWF